MRELTQHRSMEHYQTSKSYRHFLTWRLKYRVKILAVVAVLLSVHFVTASNHANRTHPFRHSGNNINSLLSNLKHSKKSIGDPPRRPAEEQGKCNPCTDDDIRREAIKLQILSKLGLKSKPRIRLPVPRDVVLETLSRAGGNLLTSKEEAKQAAREAEEEELLDGEPDDFYGRTSEIITFAEPGEFSFLS